MTLFQLVRLELNDNGEVASRRPLQPLYELHEDASAMAEFDAARCGIDYEYDSERDCWLATDHCGHVFRFVVEPISRSDLAA